MEKKTFKLKNGEITFHGDQLMITEDVWKQSRLSFINSIVWVIYGIISVLRFQETNDLFFLWTGLLIGIVHFAILGYLLLFRTRESIINLGEVISFQFKNRGKEKVLDLKLANKKTRRILGVDPVHEEMNTYFQHLEQTYHTEIIQHSYNNT